MSAFAPRCALSADAVAAAAILATAWERLGGAVLRAPADDRRDAWLKLLRDLMPANAPFRRAPAGIGDDRLVGGLDLSATLAAGAPIVARGLMSEADGGVMVLAQAERCQPDIAARIGAALDTGQVSVEREGLSAVTRARFMLVALDEGAASDEAAPALLSERLALYPDLKGKSDARAFTRTDIAAARAVLAKASFEDAAAEIICAIAHDLGVTSPRAAMFALQTARAWSALNKRRMVQDDDIALAVRLVLAPRATTMPQDHASPPPEPEVQDASPPEEKAVSDGEAERIVEAVRTALPEGLLEAYVHANAIRRASAQARGTGAQARSARRGAPLSPRSGTMRSGDRLDLIATLRAAAPWRRLHAAGANTKVLVQVRRDDFRIRRFKQRQETSIVFAVDASGSTAAQRLGEAKGAVEYLLAKAYVTRARAALIAFREHSAEVLLPPTRSLARAKRRLADLPGGGATPLAAAIEAAAKLALSERAQDRPPLIVLLTDGRGNIARDGEAGRARAQADALAAADMVRAAGLSAVVIDASPQPRPEAADLAARMGATYAPLPAADARGVADLVRLSKPTF